MARTKALVFVLAFATTIAGTGSGPGRFTIDQVLSAPFPAELTASPVGKRVAWLFNDQGRRNVWAAEGPQFKARPLTSFDADDGQVLSELTWSPDGEALVFVRGEARNNEGDYPNPTNDPAGVEQALWAVSFSGGLPRKIDPARIGLWGGSYGGYLTALGLARNSDLFAAGVDLHGVHDWSTRRFRTWAGTESQEMIKRARESSPLAAVEKWRSPVLLVHGDDDRNVDFNQTVDLVQRLRAQKVEFEQLIYPDEIHDFLLHRHWLEVYRAAALFFDKHLKREAAMAARN